jgi:ankyrin repeat protein
MRTLFIPLVLLIGAVLRASEPAPLRTALLAWEAVPARPDVQRVATDLVALAQAELSAEPGIAWVERAELDKLLAETELAVSGRLDPRASLRIGKLARAQLLLTGRLDAADHAKTSLALDVIDLEHGDLLASSTTPLPPRPHKHFALRDEDRSTAVGALRALLAEASSQQRKLAAKPALALLFLANSGPSSRLDAAGARLADALLADAEAAGARALRFPRARDAESERDLAVLGLSEADDQAWRGVADLYVWGDYKEIPGDGLAFEQTPVEASLTLWDGSSPPRSVLWRGTVATFNDAQTSFSAALRSVLRRTSVDTSGASVAAARLLLEQAADLDRRHAGALNSKDFWRSELGINFQSLRVRLLQCAAFLQAGDAPIRRALFNATWDGRRDIQGASIDELWRLYADHRTYSERFLDPKLSISGATFQRAQRAVYLQRIIQTLALDLRGENRLRIEEIRRAVRLWVEETQDLRAWAEKHPGATREYQEAVQDRGDFVLGLGNGPYFPSGVGLEIRREALDGVWPTIAPAFRDYFDRLPQFAVQRAADYVNLYRHFGEENAAYGRLLAALELPVSTKETPLAVAKAGLEQKATDRPADDPEWSSPSAVEEVPALGPTLSLPCQNLYRWNQKASDAPNLPPIRRYGAMLAASDHIRILGHDGRRLWIDGLLQFDAATGPVPADRKLFLLCPDTREFTEIGSRLPGTSRGSKIVFTRDQGFVATDFDGVIRLGPDKGAIQCVTPADGLPSLKIASLAAYEGGVVVAAAPPERSVARFEAKSGKWLNLDADVYAPETTPPIASRPSENPSRPTRLAGLGPWILVGGPANLALFDTRNGSWDPHLAEWQKRLHHSREEFARLLRERAARIGAAEGRNDQSEARRLVADMPVAPTADWTSQAAGCLLADDSAFWIGGNFGLVRYDPALPPDQAYQEACPPVLALANDGPRLWVAFAASPKKARMHYGQLPNQFEAPHSLPYGLTEAPEWRRSRIALYDKNARRWLGSFEVTGGITSLAAAPGRLWAAGSMLIEFDTRSVAPASSGSPVIPCDPAARCLGLAPFPLHQAVELRDHASLQALLAEGAAPDDAGTEGWTALHLAAHLEDAEAVALLLKAGANREAFTRDGRNALGLAAQSGNLPLVRSLLAAGADPKRQAHLHLPNYPGFEPVQKIPRSAPAQPSSSLVERLPDGRALVRWTMPADSNQDGFLIYRRDTPEATNHPLELRWNRYSPDEVPIGVISAKARPQVREWIDEVPREPGITSHYTVVAVNALDRYGPRGPIPAGSVDGPAANVETGSQLLTFETFALAMDRTPLLLAAAAGHAPVVAALLDAGGDPSAVDSGGRSALHLAVDGNHLEVVELLIAAGAPLDAVAHRHSHLDEIWSSRRPIGSFIGGGGAHTALSLVYARHENEGLFLRLLKARASPLFGPDGAIAPLAASLGREEDMERLLAAGPHPFVTDSVGRTVFTAALDSGRPLLARRLRDRAFDLQHPAWPDKVVSPLVESAFEVALRKKDLETVKWLQARGASLANEEGRELLASALKDRLSADYIGALLAAGADPAAIDPQLISQVTDQAVRAALDHKAPPITDPASKLAFPWTTTIPSDPLGPSPEDAYIDPKKKVTEPAFDAHLRAAAASGAVDTIVSMLKGGALVDAPDEKGWTALFHALRGGHQEAARHLVDAGASLNRLTSHGSSPLGFAVTFCDRAFVRELLDLGADPNLVRDESPSALDAALQKDLETARLLLARGADPRCLLYVGGAAWSAPTLFLSARRGNLPAVRLLVEHGADPKTVLWRGRWGRKQTPSLTALPYAAASNDLASLDYFISLGLDPKQENAYGDNALDWALEAKADRTAAKLRALGVKTRAERGLPRND